MSAQEWLDERWKVYMAATEGPWRKDRWKVLGGDGDMLLQGVESDGLFYEDEDALAVVDAHNHFPAALAAVEAVLDMHPEGVLGLCDNPECEGWWPCPTVTTINETLGDDT